MPSRTHLHLQRLETAFKAIETKNRQYPESNYRPPIMYRIEGVAHELAHAICLGASTLSSLDIGRTLHNKTDAEANQNELQSIRVEVAGLAWLGVHVSITRIVYEASWRPDGLRTKTFQLRRGGQTVMRSWLPRPIAVHAPPTPLERRYVDEFVSVVRKEL